MILCINLVTNVVLELALYLHAFMYIMIIIENYSAQIKLAVLLLITKRNPVDGRSKFKYVKFIF